MGMNGNSSGNMFKMHLSVDVSCLFLTLFRLFFLLSLCILRFNSLYVETEKLPIGIFIAGEVLMYRSCAHDGRVCIPTMSRGDHGCRRVLSTQ